jgi:hypothetical protein
MYLKNKYRNRLRNVESDLRIQLSEIKPKIENLVAEIINLLIKIKIPIFAYFFVCELNKIFRNLLICLLCIVLRFKL